MLPFVLLMFAGGLFLREKTPLNVRTLAGGGLMFVCVLSMLSLMVPGTDYATAGMFETAALITSGGYLGAFIASALQAALGKTISMVVLVGLVIVGLVIIGFSVSSFFEMAADRARRLAERRRVDVNDMPWGEDAEHAQAQRRMPSSRGGAAADQQTLFDDLDTAETTFLGARETSVLRPPVDDEVDEDPFVDVSEQVAAEQAKTTLIPVRDTFIDEKRDCKPDAAADDASDAVDSEIPPFDAADTPKGPAIPEFLRNANASADSPKQAAMSSVRDASDDTATAEGELQLPPLSMLRHNPHSASSASSEGN